ncbi:MAG: hypothetical protein R2792_11135 [Saprospiraceae bacterium]
MPRKNRLFVLIFLLFSFSYACVDVSSTDSLPDEEKALLQAAGKDIGRSDLLVLLQGTWFNIKDGGNVLEFIDNKVIRTLNNEVEREATLVIDSDCSMERCSAGQLEDGWCFMEKTENASYCFVVLGCTSQELRLMELGSNSDEMVYHRP